MPFLTRLSLLFIISLFVSACGGGSNTTTNTPTPLPTPNESPKAVVTSEQDFSVVGLKEVMLDGSNSTDSDGTITKYSWSQTSGTPVTIVDANKAELTFTPGNISETLTFQLTVTDNDGATDSTEVTLTVSPYFKQLTAGYTHYCAIVAESNGDELYCWGDETTPPEVNNPTAIYSGIHSGKYNHCVVDDNGTQCWGNREPINNVPQLYNVQKIAISERFACALDDTGIQCWGEYIPQLPIFSNPTDIIGSGYTLCVKDDNGVRCFNVFYEQGELPVANISDIFGGNFNNLCALNSEGMSCWSPEVGIVFASYEFSDIVSLAQTSYDICVLLPNEVNEQYVTCFDHYENTKFSDLIPNLSNPRAIAATLDSFCALDDKGISCWGHEYDNQTNPPQFDTIEQLASGFNISCAIGSKNNQDNILECWGNKNDLDMTTLPEYSNPTYISANDMLSCLIDDNGPRCWGFDISASFPHFTTKDLDLPEWTNVTVIEPYGESSVCAITNNQVECYGRKGKEDSPELVNPISLAAGDTFSCAIDDNGVTCWGDMYGKPFDVATPQLNAPTSLTAEDSHACAIADNQVHCWGKRTRDILNVPQLNNPTKVVAGPRHSCAIDDNGVTCWGDNYYGELDVPALSNPTDITVGYHYSCAKDDTGLVCWGWNGFGGTTVPLKYQGNENSH